MIFALLKNWRFLLDVLIVLVVIVALFLWNPFGIFGGKAKLVDTANMVTEIRQIGQLVTAEYYGEVISSLEEARLEFIEDENVRRQAEIVFGDLLFAINELRAFESLPPDQKEKYAENYGELRGKDRRRIVRAKLDSKNIREKMEFFSLLEELESEQAYREVFEYWYRRKNNLLGKKNFDFDSKSQDQALAALFFDNSTLPGDFYDGFMDFYYEGKKNEFSKKELRKKIAVIGRGWVKAGFDFTNLDPSALVYHESQQEIHLMGMAPSILNSDINPWFIPEKGVPGFEILDMNSKADFRDAKIVKEYCVRKLQDFAHRADILKNAERQGEETLKNLFSLLLGKEIRKVVFHHDEFLQKVLDIEKDGVISRGELVYFDSLYRSKIHLLDSLDKSKIQDARVKGAKALADSHLKFSIERLKKLTVFELGERFGYFSMAIVRMVQDGTIDESEKKMLSDWKIKPGELIAANRTVPDSSGMRLSFWFKDVDEYTREYNTALNSIRSLDLPFGSVSQVSVEWQEGTEPDFSLDSMSVLNYRRIDKANVILNYVAGKRKTNDSIQSLYYPFRIDRALIDSAMESPEIFQVDKVAFTKDSVGYFFYLPKEEAFVIGFPVKYLDLLEPAWASQFIQTGGYRVNDGGGLVFEFDRKDSLPVIDFGEQQVSLDAYLTAIAEENFKYQNRNLAQKFADNISRKIETRSANPPEWYRRLKGP